VVASEEILLRAGAQQRDAKNQQGEDAGRAQKIDTSATV
jgi:hypothetical protein